MILRTFFHKREWGAGKAGCFLGLLVVLSLGYLGYKFLPPLVNNYQFQDAVDELTSFSQVRNFSSHSESPSEVLKAEVLKKAQEMELPIGKDDVKVNMTGEHVEVRIEYVVPISLPGYTYDDHFTIKSRR
jgi:hypothetical protein